MITKREIAESLGKKKKNRKPGSVLRRVVFWPFLLVMCCFLGAGTVKAEEAVLVSSPDYNVIGTYDTEETAGENEKTGTPHNIPEPVSVPLDDGEYSIEVNMIGGGGRASVSSPTLMIIRDGKAYVRLLWSSTYYDYMILEGEYYYNRTEDGGNSTFEIPITALDEPVPVIADTTAMGDPVEIHYTLTFYEESIGSKGQIPQEAAKKVLIIAAVIIVGGGILNFFVRKMRK